MLAELTSMDPGYSGPRFHFDTIIRELIDQVAGHCTWIQVARWSGGQVARWPGTVHFTLYTLHFT